MLYGIKQSDIALLPVIRKYGCLFLCFAQQSPREFAGKEGCIQLNCIWRKAVRKKYITGDLNGNGDYDDEGEAEIRSHNGLLSLFDLKARYDGCHREASLPIPENVAFVFGKYKWKTGHFVIIDKGKNVIFDSYGVSNTVKFGKLESMRWYYAI